MTFLRGTALTTAATLGYADTADLGPTAGNGFYKRWPDDLAVLQEVGVTDLRITLDWARLQPKPGTFDADWAERFEQILEATRAIDVRTWVTLHDGSIPRWLDNEGGIDDVEALSTWWPRWVESAADRYGDHTDGWVPFSTIPPAALGAPWADTWSILGGGHAPVVASLDLDEAPVDADRVRERCHRFGVNVSVAPLEPPPSAEHWGRALRDAASSAGDRPLVVAGFDAGTTDPDLAGQLVEQLVDVLDDAIGDGVAVERCFVEPAIAGPDSSVGLFDADRMSTPIVGAYLPADALGSGRSQVLPR